MTLMAKVVLKVMYKFVKEAGQPYGASDTAEVQAQALREGNADAPPIGVDYYHISAVIATIVGLMATILGLMTTILGSVHEEAFEALAAIGLAVDHLHDLLLHLMG